jgi:hypothetical protein
MALLAIEGIYREGNVELKEKPVGIDSARVVVTFLPDGSATEAREAARRAAMERLFAQIGEGINFGGRFDRNALYDERMQELDARREQAK